MVSYERILDTEYWQSDKLVYAWRADIKTFEVLESMGPTTIDKPTNGQRIHQLILVIWRAKAIVYK